MKNFTEKASGWIAALVGFGLVRAIGFVGVLVIYIPIGAGILLANKLGKKINPRLLKVMMWSNLVTWLLPILGLFVGTVTGMLLIKGTVVKKDRLLAENLTVFGIIFSFSNSLLAILNSLSSNTSPYTLGSYAQHLIFFAIGGYMIWYAIRIHLGQKYKSTLHKILLGIASFTLVWLGIATLLGVGEAWVTRNDSASSEESKISYWASFQQQCEKEALKNEGITPENASKYCGCMASELKVIYTPEQIESTSADSSSAYSRSVDKFQPECASSAGLELE